MAASSGKVADPAPLPRSQRPARRPQNKHFKKHQRRVCARCADTIEASRCAARAGARANNTAHADVRVNGAARARAALAPTKPLATALAQRRRSRSSFATAPDRVAGGGDGRGGGGWRHARLSLASARGHIRRRRYCGEIQDWMRAHRHAGHIRKLVITAHHGITLTTLTLATAPARTISSLRRWWRREAANDRVVGGGGWRHARLSLTWHTSRVKAEPQGAGSANVYSLRRSSGVGTVLICRRHQQWGGARIAAHPRREANGGGRPRRARARSGSHRRQRLLRHHSAHRAWTGPTLRIRGPSCVYAAHRAFTRPIVRKRWEVRDP